MPSSLLYPALPTNTVVLQAVNDTFQASYEGLSRHTLRVFGNKADIYGAGPWTTQGSGLTISPHFRGGDPLFSYMGLFSISYKNARGGYQYADLEYRGLSPVYGGTPPGPVYSLDRSTSNEPIQTHPKWTSAIAGTPASPKNGAVYYDPVNQSFNPNGNTGAPAANFCANTASFDHWGLNTDGTRSIFTGIEDYLVAGQTWTSTYVAFSPPSDSDEEDVGYVVTPDGSPPTPSGFQWIYLGCRYTDQAAVFRIDKSWRLYPNGPAVQIIYNP